MLEALGHEDGILSLDAFVGGGLFLVLFSHFVCDFGG